MKKVLLGLLTVVLILGALGAAGFAGYRYGFNQKSFAASNGDTQRPGPRNDFGPQGMPMHNFGNGFDRGFGPGGFHMMRRGMGFGFFSPFLAHIAFWGLIIWAIYMLVKRSGWRLSVTKKTNENPPTVVETEPKE